MILFPSETELFFPNHYNTLSSKNSLLTEHREPAAVNSRKSFHFSQPCDSPHISNLSLFILLLSPLLLPFSFPQMAGEQLRRSFSDSDDFWDGVSTDFGEFGYSTPGSHFLPR